MQRSRLKNIINKSKNLNNSIDSFEGFKNSLPKEIKINDNYRLKAAWKAYGSPKNYQEALWEGLIQPIDENTFKLPSIGYNEETDEYEYLNKGKENDTVAKDIRVWDNDIIPFVKELKLGGYVRLYNEEKDCWTYSKNKPQENQNKSGEIIDSFQKGGKSNQDIPSKMELSEINDKTSFLGYLHTNGFDVSKYNYDAIWDDENARNKFLQKLQDIDQGLQKFKSGGQMNVIPEGSLHARKNNMELAEKGEITHKGIPVIDNNGTQQAEIEKEEIIFCKRVTDKLEKFYKQFNTEETSKEDQDKIAIECGQLLCKEILENTEDRTGLILEMEGKQ